MVLLVGWVCTFSVMANAYWQSKTWRHKRDSNLHLLEHSRGWERQGKIISGTRSNYYLHESLMNIVASLTGGLFSNFAVQNGSGVWFRKVHADLPWERNVCYPQAWAFHPSWMESRVCYFWNERESIWNVCSEL